MHEHKALWIVLAAAALICSCRVVLVSGPSTVAIGDTVTYQLEVSGNTTGSPSNAILIADVPAGWELESSTFEGNANGQHVAREIVVIQSTNCSEQLGEVRPGFRRWYFLGGGGETVAGLASLEFSVESQPGGAFEIFFAFAGDFGCSPLAILGVNRQQPYLLRLLQTLSDGGGGGDGLAGASQAALSADGTSLYVASAGDLAFTAFARDPDSGQLTFVESESEDLDELSVPRGLAVSPDGAQLYGASLAGPGGLGETATFLRDPGTGELTFEDSIPEQADNVVLSADGEHLYTGDADSIDVYSRDPSTGALSFVQTASRQGRVAIAPDGRHLFAVEGGQLVVVHVFSRDETTGELTFFDELVTADGLVGSTEVAVSPDGRHLYVVGRDAVTVYERNPTTGDLVFVESETTLTGAVHHEITVGSVAVSPDGSHVVAAGEAALSTFSRDKTTGALTFLDVVFGGNLPIDGVPQPGGLAFAPDGRHLYVVDPLSDTMIGLETPILFFDGFESGDLSAW
jgi:6-phosphogluconolactonase (cycloisomerase 2 family)